MPKFNSNLTMMFNEVGFLDRFERAHNAGFKAVEFLFPYDFPKGVIAEKLQKYQLEQVLFNLPPGNFAAGERGLACIPGREAEFRQTVATGIEYAKALKCPRLNCFAGIAPKDIPADKVRKTLVENLRYAAGALEKEKIMMLVEPLNIFDMPGMFLNRTQSTVELIQEVGSANLKLQYDFYHMQIMEGNLTKTFRDNLKYIGHIQLADVPGRHEPGTGEINYTNLFKFVDEAGYQGWIGCEYRPLGKTEDGLGWLKPYLK